MKRIDSVILREIIGPWCFGVAMFSVIIFASSFLFQFSSLLVQGAPIGDVIRLTAYMLPGVIIKTFPMAILLAALLGFGRLSSDSEIVAMRAAGVSIRRLMYPVAFFSVAIAIVSFALNEIVVPPATLAGLTLQDKLLSEVKMQGEQPLAFTQKDKEGHVTALIAATDFDLASRTLRGVTITAFDKSGHPSFCLFAPLFRNEGGQDWRIIGGSRLTSADGSFSAILQGDTWPSQVAKVQETPQDILRQGIKNLDGFSAAEMLRQIKEAKET